MSGFGDFGGFGPADKPAGSSGTGSLFGSAAGASGSASSNSDQSKPSLFGFGSGSTPSSGTSLFGSKPSGGLFGAGASTPTTSAGSSTPLFGAVTTGTAMSSTPKSGDASSGKPASSLFGTPAPLGTGLFGSSTTPAGAPPVSSGGSSIFSQKPAGGDAPPSTGGSSLFSNLNKPSPPTSGSSLFGAPAAATTSADSAPATTATAGANAPVNTLFGKRVGDASDEAKQPEKKSPFGAPTTATSSPSTTTPAKSLFGATATSISSSPVTTAPTGGPSLFSNAAITTTAPASASTGSPSLFGAPKSDAPATTAATTTAPATSSLFGAPSPVTTSAAANTAATPAATTTAPGETKSLFGATPVSTATPATVGAGSLFGSATTKPSEASDTPTTSSLFPSKPTETAKPEDKKDDQAAQLTKEEAKKKEGDGVKEKLGASLLGTAPPAKSRLKNKTMDEIITRWATDLSKYQKEFQSQAEQVASWDRMVVENASKIQKLYGSAVDSERATAEVERQLAAVENQQEELGLWLDRYEQEVEALLDKQVGPSDTLQGPDQERENTYKLAERVSDRLNGMNQDLTSIIEEINATSTSLNKSSDADEPVSQIVRILNSHITQLQSIDQDTAALRAQVTASQKLGDSIAGNMGASFGSSVRSSNPFRASVNGSAGVPPAVGNSAVDDFYKAYVGLYEDNGKVHSVPLNQSIGYLRDHHYGASSQIPLVDRVVLTGPLSSDGRPSVFRGRLPGRATLVNLLDAMHVMQKSYFEIWRGTWPSCNDWTAEVMATQVASTLSALTATLSSRAQRYRNKLTRLDVIDGFAFENTLNYYFDHLATFYFGEHTTSLPNQAYDDMLWTVLNWLENVKLQDLHSSLRYTVLSHSVDFDPAWHGTQFRGAATHRARQFYDLASHGWDTGLCGGGMTWNPRLQPYKNAITNELYISASMAMYLYYSDDLLTHQSMLPSSPSAENQSLTLAPEIPMVGRHNPAYLQAARTAYNWLKSSKMTLKNGLYADGFHIKGYKDAANPGTKQCDVLSQSVFTYNQGVLLSGLKGLWLATGDDSYLKDGHELVKNVMRATGWPEISSQSWKGIGRGGVMEDRCDSSGKCSQDSQTFKSVFWHHFTEFCRPLYVTEESILHTFFPNVSADAGAAAALEDRRAAFMQHQRTCSTYLPWIKHNANAAMATKNKEGKFGMWWGRQFPDSTKYGGRMSALSFEETPRATSGADKHSGNATNVTIRKISERQDLDSKIASELDMGETLVSDTADSTVLVHGSRRNGRYFRKKQQQHRRPSVAPRVITDGTPSEEEQRGLIVDGDDDLNKEVHTWKEVEAHYADVNDRGRGRTVETQAGAVAVLRAQYVWESSPTLAQLEAVGRWGTT
ncbi:hypothetical protein KEM54_003220 [Ascosphaera aggregata]|nr:hypothetical protein KEM54_003220 [Ascosphaera aggregata]